MSNRLMIAAMIYMMVQAVTFGVGLLIVLLTPLQDHAMQALPWMIVITLLISAPLAWALAPRLTARYWAHRPGDVISG
jgi:hypothetical protein